MTDRYRVYTKAKKMLKHMLKLDHQGQVVTLAMMISGIVMSRKAQPSVMSSEIPTETKEKSVEMRRRRWVKGKLEVEAVYMPFARQILEAVSPLPLTLVMDGSQAGRGCRVFDGWRTVSETGVTDSLAGVQAQERTCQRGTPYSGIEKGFAAPARGQRSGLIGRCRV
jgi:hypothetical protein